MMRKLFSALLLSGVFGAAPLFASYWAASGPLNTARFSHTMTVIPGGKVLVTGGQQASYLSSAELYDPATSNFSYTGSMASARYFHTATLLANGRVLVAGGYSNPPVYYPPAAELYDPASGLFTLTGEMLTPRQDHTATLLPNGKVLIASGFSFGLTSSAELYDPATGTFSATGPMITARRMHRSVLLGNGKVLLMGGQGDAGTLSSAELYDPATGTFSATGAMSVPRVDFTATLLPSGKVLVAGGRESSPSYSSAEIYDPATGTFSATGSMTAARNYHTATLLPDGKVLISAGRDASYLSSAELYDPDSGVFASTSSLVNGMRAVHGAVRLDDGAVLVAGGMYNGSAIAASTIYMSSSVAPSIAVIDPANGAYLNSLSSITGTASDDVMVSSVQVSVQRQSDGYYWNGAAFTAVQAWLQATVLSTGPAAAWSYATVPAWLNGATYEINARAMDSSGNWSVPYSTAVFHYDTGTPVSVVTVPAQDTSVSSLTAISGTAWDNESFIGQVWVKINRVTDNNYWNGALSQWTVAEVWNLASGSATWTYAGLPDASLTAGATYFAVSRAADLAGNVQPFDVLGSTFVYATPPDTVPPTAAILSPGDGSTLSSLPSITGTAADDVAVTSVTVSVYRESDGMYWDGSAWGAPQAWLNATLSTAAWSYAVLPVWVDMSTYTVLARAMDASGNWSVDYATSTFIFDDGLPPPDATPPTIAVLQPVHGSTVTALAALTGTAADDVAVASVTVSVYRESDGMYWDGSAWGAPQAWLNATLSTPAWSYAVLPTWADMSTYTVLARAMDTSGNWSVDYATSTFFYDEPDPPVLSSAAFSGAGTGSLTMNWGSTFDAGTNYFVRLTTHPASSPYVAMATTTALAYGFSGLTPDTTYYGFVSTMMASGYIASGEGLTYAAAPSSAAFTAVAYSSAALAWSGNSNPAWTVYEYQVHTSSAFASFTSSGSLAASGAWSGGLSQGTTYFARVRAIGADGTPTSYALAGPAVTARLYAAGTPAGVAGVTLGVSSISWSWNSGTLSSADIFIAREGGVMVSTQPFGASGAYTQEGLTPNTSHTLSVTGSNANGETAAAVSSVVYTLAAQPSGLAAAFVSPSSASLAWGLNGNAAGTPAQLWRSPDDASYTNVYEGAALSYTDAALEECTVYYYKARNTNGAGVYTAFTAPVSFTTAASTPAAPGGLYAEALDGARIALSWEHSPSVGIVTQYRLYYDNASGTVDYGTPYTVFSSTVSSWTTPALTAGNTYKFALRAVTRCGVEEANASAAYAQAVGVLSGVRAAIKAPQTGKRIKGNSVTVMSELTLGLPSQVRNVRFQYRLAGNVAWTDIAAANINHPNPDTAAPYFVHWDADSMAAGTYELRALATDVFDTADPAPPIVTVVVDPVDFDTSESVLAGQVQKEQKIVNTVPSTVQAGDDSTALLSKVVIPAGAVSVTTAAVTLIPNPPARPAPPAGSGDLAIAVKINLSNGQSQLAGGNSAVITLSYKDDDGDGVVDGTTAEVGRLRIYAASDTGTTWTPLASTVDRTLKTVSAPTTHFSFFSAFSTPAAGLSSMKAYPNPWQPGAGGRFDAAAVTFTGLPNEARIKIFTILGELVRQIDVTAADAGTKTWDGRNSNGSKAASGIYLVRVESGGDDRTLKLAVER